MNYKADLEIILRALRSSLIRDKHMRYTGICNNIRWPIYTRCHSNQPFAVKAEIKAEYYKIIDGLFRSWPEFSGDVTYPVGGRDEYYSVAEDMWDNPKRRELLDYMINTLAEERHAAHK